MPYTKPFMNRSKAAITAVVLVPLAAFSIWPVLRYSRAGGETLELNEQERRHAPGLFVRLSAGITHYQVAGPDESLPLVLVPGFSTPYNVWDPTFWALANADIRVIRYDLYGRGWSDRPDAAYDADFYDRQILDLIDALQVPKIDIAGVSMGGPIAAEFANRHSDRVRKVLLFDPGYWKAGGPSFAIRTPILGEYNMAVNIAPGLPQSQMADFLHPEKFPTYLEPYYTQMRYRGFRRALLRTLRNYLSQDVTGEYTALGRGGKPVLLVWGKADQDVPFELSGQVRKAIPQAEFHPVEDAAHIPHYEHPEIVNPIVIDFLQRP